MDKQWQDLIVNQLTRIEKKIDNKVSNPYCKLQHSKGKQLLQWLSIALSTLALLGFLYTGFQIIQHDEDKVTIYGK